MIRLPVRPLLAATALLVGLALAVTADAGPGAPENADFDAANLRDDLRGVVDNDGLCIAFFATAGSRVSFTLSPDDTEAARAGGVSLELIGPDEDEIAVAGTRSDRSNSARDIVRWRGVRLEQSGVHTLVARAATPGGVRLQLIGRLARVRDRMRANEPLAAGAEVEFVVSGAAGGRLQAVVRPLGRGFRPELVRVQRPDGTPLALDDDQNPARIALDADGEHTVVFRNAAETEGRYRAAIATIPPRARLRRAAVRDGMAAFVPSARSIDPRRGVHRDDKLEITIAGLDFQDGADVRLVRRGFADILATDVDVVSPTEIRATLNLDTRDGQGKASIGKWKLGIWNDPQYTEPGDRTTLVRDSFTQHQRLSFTSVAAASVTLPRGTRPGTEVWLVEFGDGFQDDLDAMGLGSNDPVAREAAREAVEAYVLMYLRDLFVQRARDGRLQDAGVPVSFIVKEPSSLAGEPGVDYNVIEIGGEQQAGDPQDADGPLAWGFAPLDAGNAQRDELRAEDADGNRLGLGARTAVLDPGGSSVAQDWIDAMAPLRGSPLTLLDRIYFADGFFPQSTGQAARYAQVVNQIERAAREIAAIAGHHVGRAMGLPGAGAGPMQNPQLAGTLWTARNTLSFATNDRNALTSNAVPHALPGMGGRLLVGFFPLIDQRPFLLPELTTDTDYTVNWDFVGGRPNAVPSDYSMGYARGSELPLGLSLSFTGLSGKAPVFLATNTLYCRVVIFQTLVRDNETNVISAFLHRLNVTADPLNAAFTGNPALQLQATNCSNAVRNQ